MDDKPMFYGAKPGIFHNARLLRNSETDAEKKLWEHLKRNQMEGARFKRQHPIAGFVADFYCHRVKLVIEIDELYHDRPSQRDYDLNRDAVMKELGLKVIRFKDHELFENIELVLEEIRKQFTSQDLH